MLNRIPRHDQLMAREALLWLSHTTAPLTLDEINEVVVLRDNCAGLDDGDRLYDLYLIPNISQGLISYNARTHYVSLAHFSVNEYLTSSRRKHDNPSFYIESHAARTNIAKKCLTYLSFPAFASGPCDHFTLDERHEDWPLLQHAAWYWGEQVKILDENIDRGLQQLIHDFFATAKLPNGGAYRAWIQTRYPDRYVIDHLQTEPLYYACSLGLTSIVRAMFDVDPSLDVNLRGGRSNSPIVQTAAYYGCYETAKFLLERGADPNLINCRGDTALDWTMLKKYDAITDLLRHYGAVSKAQDLEPNLKAEEK